MDIVVLIARWLHIVLGTLWVGMGVTAAFIIHPAADRLDDGVKYLKALYSTTPFNRLMPIAAITTTVAGLFLYWQGNLVAQLGGSGHAILGIGTLAGLAAFGHGIGLGRVAEKFAEADDINSEETQALADRLGRNARISAYLTLVAVIFMALAREASRLF